MAGKMSHHIFRRGGVREKWRWAGSSSSSSRIVVAVVVDDEIPPKSADSFKNELLLDFVLLLLFNIIHICHQKQQRHICVGICVDRNRIIQ